MFGFIADILTSVTSILFPIFASYKALRTSDPAVLTPWLMYWTTLSLFLLVESQLYFILYWVPFYSWIRLGVHLYLVAPGKQGSVFIYRAYIHPFLEDHERQIDRFISEAHARGKAAGMDAVQRAIEYVRVQALGGQPRQPSPPPSRATSYSSYLMDRFAMPSARQGFAAAGTADLFNLLGKALQQSTGHDAASSDAVVRELSASGNLVPSNLTGEERSDFVNTQRDRLRSLLQAFDAEATTTGSDPHHASPTPRHPSSRKSYLASDTHLSKSRSESEFEDLAYEPMPDPDHYRAHPRGDQDPGTPSGRPAGLSGWLWGSYGEKDSAVEHRKDQ